jgi:hypothetical protein
MTESYAHEDFVLIHEARQHNREQERQSVHRKAAGPLRHCTIEKRGEVAPGDTFGNAVVT